MSRQQSKQVAYTDRAIYEALRDLRCAGGDHIEKGQLFTRRKVEGFGDRNFNFCRSCAPFQKPTEEDRERFSSKQRKQRPAKLLRLRDGAEVKLTWRAEQRIGTLFCMYSFADFWKVMARAAEIMRGRAKNARLDDGDLSRAEQELTRGEAVEMLPREERVRRGQQMRGSLTLDKINEGYSIEGDGTDAGNVGR